MKPTVSMSVVLFTISVCMGCARTAKRDEVKRPDAVTGATDIAPKGEPTEKSEVRNDSHPCFEVIEKPGDVWRRIETIRSLSESEKAMCDLSVVEIFDDWMCPPPDILHPLIEKARTESGGLEEWVEKRKTEHPKQAACVVAGDILSGWKAGDSPEVPADIADNWSKSAENCAEMGEVLKEAKLLAPLLKEVNEIHRLRCMLEVNVLGFAVDCKPIHPSNKPIDLSWKSSTSDGLLVDLTATRCKGSSCRRLEATAKELVTRYRALLAEVKRLAVSEFADSIKSQMFLPPFNAR